MKLIEPAEKTKLPSLEQITKLLSNTLLTSISSIKKVNESLESIVESLNSLIEKTADKISSRIERYITILNVLTTSLVFAHDYSANGTIPDGHPITLFADDFPAHLVIIFSIFTNIQTFGNYINDLVKGKKPNIDLKAYSPLIPTMIYYSMKYAPAVLDTLYQIGTKIATVAAQVPLEAYIMILPEVDKMIRTYLPLAKDLLNPYLIKEYLKGLPKDIAREITSSSTAIATVSAALIPTVREINQAIAGADYLDTFMDTVANIYIFSLLPIVYYTLRRAELGKHHRNVQNE